MWLGLTLTTLAKYKYDQRVILPQAQHLESSKAREMYCPMPVINCVAIVSAKLDHGSFMCVFDDVFGRDVR